jgi:hypothetical protein
VFAGSLLSTSFVSIEYHLVVKRGGGVGGGGFVFVWGGGEGW